jgi:hypothetical protein
VEGRSRVRRENDDLYIAITRMLAFGVETLAKSLPAI